MRVIFLDFDGVLNTWDYNFLVDPDAPNSHALDPKALELVNQIIEQTGAVVVLSTAWREHHKVETLVGYLEERGFKGKVIGRTPILGMHGTASSRGVYVERGYEVQRWLAKNKVESFVILDDLDEFPMFGDRHILTSGREGLVRAHVAQAVKILQTPLEEPSCCTA